MKARMEIVLVIAFLVAVGVWSSAQRKARSGRASNGGACCPLIASLDGKPVTAGTNQVVPHAAPEPILAYYFHGTVRCETCLLVERLAKMVIEQQFSAELATNRLFFLSVNYDLPENRHFLTDYHLPCPSLVLVRQLDGRQEDWKLLAETWQLVHDPIRLNAYVETEVRSFLNVTKQPAGANATGLAPALDRQ